LDPHQLVDDGVDMPVPQIGCAWQDGLEALPDKEAQIVAQDRGKNGPGRSFGSLLI
jgi:hypothetical protein